MASVKDILKKSINDITKDDRRILGLAVRDSRLCDDQRHQAQAILRETTHVRNTLRAS